MFKESITSTVFTSSAANDYFNRIEAYHFNYDVTFGTTLRALFWDKLPEDRVLKLRYYNCMATERTIMAHQNKAMFESMFNFENNDSYYNDTLYIISVTSGGSDTNAVMKFTREKFEELCPGWHVLPDVEALFKKSFEVVCYINPEMRSTMVVVPDLNTRKWHGLQCAVTGMLPWLWGESEPNADEIELLYACREKTPDRYNAIIEKMAAKYDFRTARIKRLLKGFENRADIEDLNSLEASIERIRRNIADYNTKIGQWLRDIDQANIRVMGLRFKIDSGSEDSEIMDYFLTNKHLYLEDISGSTVYFSAWNYLMFYDEEMVKRCLDNDRSFVYSYLNRDISKEDMKSLMTAIFLDNEIKIRFCAAYTLSLTGNVSAQTGHCFPAEFSNCMPNPHIDRYRCMGNYTRVINELMMNRDYIGSLNQCIASSQSLNWADSTVMCDFFRHICGYGNYTPPRCIELPDGKVVTPKEAIKWLKEQKGNDGEVNE